MGEKGHLLGSPDELQVVALPPPDLLPQDHVTGVPQRDPLYNSVADPTATDQSVPHGRPFPPPTASGAKTDLRVGREGFEPP